jgi:hypothetical protein
VTGGGYIQIGSGKHGKANFGVTGGISKKGKLRGHLTYIDHSAGFKVKGTGVTAYVEIDARTRRIEGTAKIGKVAVTYQVDVTDNGEPGKNDSFAITLSNGYSASGTLAGGNIQLHKRHCGKKKHGHHGHGDHDDDGHDDDDDDGDDDDDRDEGKKRH